ncbi:uncharacterized protein LOC118742313 isoform X1 [Rhagoletis pomonella]|uniref:uncharacterized protein LOC118742313 isoform X1 n=1 Tax=Rhagoletis pomonella TaxID=28610 RepID=UPI00177E2281|nr:uncharacterized protein LOC118742313 isoform X1 [Rhagoletis pomonella]
MELSYLQEVKAIIKSLVLSSPDAMSVDALNRDYRSTEGSPIPYKKLGFQTLEAFLRSIPDTVNVYGSGLSATVCIVLNEKSDHIHKMVCQQRKTRTRTRAKPPRLRVSQCDFTNFNKSRSAGQKPVSKRYTGDSLPTSNIRFSHSASRSTPRNTVIKCQALDLPAAFIVRNFQRTSGHLSGMQTVGLSSKTSNSETNQTPIAKSVKSYALPNEKSRPMQNEPEKLPKDTTKPPAEDLDLSFEKLMENCTIHGNGPDSGSLQQLSKEKESESQPMPVIQFPQKVNRKMLNYSVISKNYVCTTPKVFELNKSIDEKRRIDEMEEAVPAYAANNLVFRMDFPENTMTFGKVIPQYKIPDNVRRGSIIGIFISEIHSPFKFWFHIYKEHHDLDMLMLQIERFYTSLEPEEFCIPRVCICPGQVCAALYKGLWHRAEVLSSVIDNKTKVSFVDYGTVSEVAIENIKFLLTAFAILPKQAIRGSLSHIRPKNLHWCQESIHYFLSMSCELMLYGQISEISDTKRTIYMVLCDTNGTEVVQINRELVEKGFALYDEEWQKFDKGDKRLHHLREDIPTFSMLELGEYPSFAELIDLKNKGIDYEWIIDHNVYHPGRLDLHENVPDAIRKLPFQLLTTNPFRRDIYLQLQHLI